ncbi:MAG TPA: flagellar motor switch protein FliN [Leptospiraceae bacterium]|nr:flagellar motor switch protein FliN [Leptospiraceae bacterium]HMY66839.1 flagellar motor switch protein FliN [Leptospiraceae bacterium]HNF16137.1 flagellar motor switch protein FliN [Leptospiraceae bacterium]HNF24100.1 flagellar motor switch protein FliN [Leptospiraceae bacterium]HNI94711.1 flagellar motor switch protein FliN [Leptospiraceae bacterium]
MGEGSLSQDEIDALLQGADESSFAPDPVQPSGPADPFSPTDKDFLTEIISSAFGVAANTLESVLAKPVRFTSPIVEAKTAQDLAAELGAESVSLVSNLTGAVNGRTSLVISVENASKIVSVLMGGLSTGGFDSARQQTLKNNFAPVMGMVGVQIGLKLNSVVQASPLEISMAKTPKDMVLPDGKMLVKIAMNLNIETVAVFKVYYIMSQATAEEILALFKKGPQKTGGTGGGINISVPAANTQSSISSQQNSVGIKGIAFPSLSNAAQPSGATNLNLLMDVQMSVTVELGRTKMYIKDILGLGEGSIIELDKLAGEPVDLLVNGKLIAKGEVVVIDENFGVRVTDIVSPTDRIKSEGK